VLIILPSEIALKKENMFENCLPRVTRCLPRMTTKVDSYTANT
jgi:hypothetical protein